MSHCPGKQHLKMSVLASLNRSSLSSWPFTMWGQDLTGGPPPFPRSVVPPRCSRVSCIILINIIKVIDRNLHHGLLRSLRSSDPALVGAWQVGGGGVLKTHWLPRVMVVERRDLGPAGRLSLLTLCGWRFLGSASNSWKKTFLFCSADTF